MSETIVLGAKEWLVAAVSLIAGVSLIAMWSYAAPRSLNRASGWLALFAKSLAILALAVSILEPMRKSERPRPGANLIAAIVDNSRSMEVHPPGVRNHLDRFKLSLESDAPWQTRLAQDFELRRYAFDRRIHAVEDFSQMKFDGNHSALADAITTIQSRFESRPVAAALVFTDGLATDAVSDLSNKSFAFPIYPVVFSDAAELSDIAVGEPSVTMSNFELAPAAIEANILCRGLVDNDIVVRLMDLDGQTLDTQRLTCDQTEFEKRVHFQYQPKGPGLQFVRVRAMLASEDSDKADLESRLEVTTANNHRLVAIDRGGGPFRILYVAGRPNWDFKFLNRAIQADIEVELTGLLRIANKEPKFVFGDRGVDSTNPLFAGFADDNSAAEQYDEPVLLRIGVEQDDELKAGFPKTEESLYQYHAIILDDIEAPFFSQEQMLLLRQFVSERGGGLLMMGGQESFMGGGYEGTPLGDVLPVYLRGQDSQFEKDRAVRYMLTREGKLEPWLRLRATEAEERTRTSEMPDFRVWNAASDVKPGASILAELATDGQSTVPGFVAQRFGKGRSAAILVGDFWRWSLRRSENDMDDLAQNWRQIARWLTSDVPRRVDLEIEKPQRSDGAHRLTVTVRNPAFKPQDNATIKLKVTQPDGNVIELGVEPDRQRPGLYATEYWSQSDGAYRCEVEATSPDGEPLGKVVGGWTAQPSAVEFQRVMPDIETLRDIAKASGGKVVRLDELESFAAELPTAKVPITETRLDPLWHQPWLLALAIGCLCVEWGVRRLKGLP